MTELYKDYDLMNQIRNTENGLLDLLSNYATEKTTASTLSNLQGIKKKVHDSNVNSAGRWCKRAIIPDLDE